MNFPDRQHFTRIVPICGWKHSVTPPATDSWKPAPGFLWSLPHVPSPFALYPFTVINHSCEYNYVPSPISPPIKS